MKSGKFSKQIFSRFFAILLLLLPAFSYDYLISPREGNWANFQTLIIDVPEGATAFYSFTGDDPLFSGFAYDSPILLEIEGKVNLKIAVVKEDGSSVEESVSFSSAKGVAPIFDELHESSLPLISVNFEKPLVIPENIRYSIGDDVLPYLSGRRLSVSKDNAYEQVLPLILKDKNKLYRYMIFTGDVSEINKSTKPSSSILQSARKMQSTETLREFPLKECPFSLEVQQWNSLVISAPQNIFVALDEGNWQSGEFSLRLDRSKEHLLYWIDVTPSEESEENEVQTEKFVCFARLPVKPSLILEKNEESKTLTVKASSELYSLALIQKLGFGKKLSAFSNSFLLDTVEGDEIYDDVDFACYFDDVFQGTLSCNVEIDRKNPVAPKFVSSAKSLFVRNDVDLSIESNDDVYFFTRASEFLESEKDADKILTRKDAFDISKTKLLTDKKIHLHTDSDKAVLFSVFTYAKDRSGNMSDVAVYNVVIDSTNYYFSQKEVAPTYIPDGTQNYPFNSLSQLEKLINENKKIKVHLIGDLNCTSPLNIKGSCEIVSKNGSRITVLSDSFMNMEDADVLIKNCVIEHDFSKKNNDFVQVNLFNVKNSNLVLKNCELVSIVQESSSVFVLQDSSLKVESCGISMQSGDYGSIFNGVNSDIECINTRNSLTCKTSTAISLNAGNCRLQNSSFQLYGSMVKFYELFSVNYSLVNNKFLYKEFSPNMFFADVFSQKIQDENNISKIF